MVGSVFFCVEKTLLLGELPQPAEISPLIFEETEIEEVVELPDLNEESDLAMLKRKMKTLSFLNPS